jgi:hypothetical protein
MKILLYLFITTLLASPACRKNAGQITAGVLTGKWTIGAKNLTINADGTWGALTGSPVTGMQIGGSYNLRGSVINLSIGTPPCIAPYTFSVFSSEGVTMLSLALNDSNSTCRNNSLAGTYRKQ